MSRSLLSSPSYLDAMLRFTDDAELKEYFLYRFPKESKESLQAVISLKTYAGAAEDDDAAALVSRMQSSAAAALPRFDTGYWSYYSLPHEPSPLEYHEYVVQLLKRLAPSDPRFAAAATRFAAYETQPPAFQLAPGALGTLTFWLSKPSAVSVVTGAGPARRVSLDGGWHTLSWPTPSTLAAVWLLVSPSPDIR